MLEVKTGTMFFPAFYISELKLYSWFDIYTPEELRSDKPEQGSNSFYLKHLEFVNYFSKPCLYLWDSDYILHSIETLKYLIMN